MDNNNNYQIKNVKDFINKVVEIGKREQKRNDIPQGMEVVFVKEPINVKVALVITLIVFCTLTIMNSATVLSSGVTSDKFFAHLIGIAFHSILVGVSTGIALFPVVNGILKLLHCTKKVTAKIEDVRIETTLERDTENRVKEVRSCYPVYRYEYAGKIYIIEAARNRHIGTPRIGKTLKFHINPNNPQDYYFLSIIRDAIIVLLGGILTYFVSLVNIFTKYL